MKLQSGKVYVRHDGRHVRIMGPARVDPVEEQRVFWALDGDHYSEDGRFVSGRSVHAPGVSLTDTYESYLMPADNWRSIAREL